MSSGSVKTVFKSVLTKNFTVLPNEMLRDKTLSFKARGLLGMALSNNAEWKVNKGWLESQSDKDGREATDSALTELRSAGYVVFYRRHRGGGLIENVWEFHDTPGHKPPNDRTTDSPHDGKTVGRFNRTTGKPSPLEETSYEETVPEETSQGRADAAVVLPKEREAAPSVVSPNRIFTDAWCKAFEEKFGGKYSFQGGRDGKATAELMKYGQPHELVGLAKRAWNQTDEKKFWSCVNLSSTISKFLNGLPSIRVELSRINAPKKFNGCH